MNHGFVTTKKDIDPAAVDAELHLVAQTAFEGVLTVKRSGDWWLVSHDGFPAFGCTVSIAAKRKLRFRRASTDEFAGWVQNVLQCSLAKLLNGKLSDEGMPGQRDPAKELKATWKSYFDMVFGHSPKQAEAIWKRQVAQLPPDLLKLAEKA